MKELKPYGDLTKLNKCRDLLDTIGRDTLDRIAHSYLDLLDTSAAIYEVDGSYATALFSSSYCLFMDRSSRALCETENNEEALASGKWICHESCWTRTSRRTVETGEPHDLQPCEGGINLFGVPIKAGDRIIGSINMGYGTPPTDEKTVGELAETFKVDPNDLREAANAYIPRPDFIVEAARKHILLAAELIGELYLRKKAEGALHALNQELGKKVEERTAEIRERMEELEGFQDMAVGREMKMIELKREINDLLKELGRKEKYVIHEVHIR